MVATSTSESLAAGTPAARSTDRGARCGLTSPAAIRRRTVFSEHRAILATLPTVRTLAARRPSVSTPHRPRDSRRVIHPRAAHPNIVVGDRTASNCIAARSDIIFGLPGMSGGPERATPWGGTPDVQRTAGGVFRELAA